MANRHLVGFVNDKDEEQALLTELGARGIPYWKDEFPFGGLHDKRSRIFVFGCDIRRVTDLRDTHGLRQNRE